jgi:hypothetical protein
LVTLGGGLSLDARCWPNAHTFSSLLKGCVGLQSLSMRCSFMRTAVVIKLLDEGSRDCFVWNALIDAHAKLGALSNAEWCSMG